MWSRGRKAVTGVAIAVTVMGTLAMGTAASVALPVDVPPPVYLIPTDARSGVTDGLPEEKYQTQPSIPLNVSEALLRIQVERPDLEVVGSEWDARTSKTILYAAGEPEQVSKALEMSGVANDVAYVPARYGPDELQALINKVTGENGQLSSGQQVAEVAPTLDGTLLRVTLDEAIKSEGVPSLPSLDIPIEISYGAAAVPAVRNHLPTPQRFAGAGMHNDVNACSSGFRVTRVSDLTPAMVSAEHCNGGGDIQWYYGSTTGYPIGSFTGSAWPGGAQLPDMALWIGGGAANLAPGIFIGDQTVPGSTVYAIKGATTTPVGAVLCFSGAYSGTVCSNVVNSTFLTVCYTGLGYCYERLAKSAQVAGIPAAGQGDSGGPSYTTGGGIYANGIISGIQGATTTCTGDGGRLCSPTVYTAPIADVFTMGYGVNYVP